MLPKQIEALGDDRTALAPYNFVPLPERVVTVEPFEQHDQYVPGRHTGRIDCTLTTDSPLYVRCGLTRDQVKQGIEAKSQSDFFYLASREEPVIPGSSLRGMLRSLVEVAGYGKLEKISDRRLVYRSIDTTSLGASYRDRLMRQDAPRQYTPMMKAGYMERDGSGWRIRPAKEVNGVSFARIWIDMIPRGLRRWRDMRNSSEIWVEAGPYEYQSVRGDFLRIRYSRVQRAAPNQEEGMIPAVLVRSGPMPTKKREAVIFAKDTQAAPIAIPDELVKEYKEQISKEQANLLGPPGVLQEDHPVFYLLEPVRDEHTGEVSERLTFFGHVMMFRIPYRAGPEVFVPEALRRPSDTDLADALFGCVRGDHMLAGRIFVGDATLVTGQEQVWFQDQAVTPQILGSPKPTTFQHYLVQDERTRGVKDQLRHYASKPESETVVRGHKQYWHKGAEPPFAMDAEQRRRSSETQLTSIRPVRSGVSFSFSLRFENLSEAELGALLWVLQVGADPRYRLKLGMGKPLGLGAVRIEARVSLSNREVRYTTLFSDTAWEVGEAALSDEQRESCLSAFHQLVLEGSGEGGGKVTRIDQTLRIQCLLALLRWPGPQLSDTRYMEIERDSNKPHIGQARGLRVNEYRERPVLPTPRQVMPGTQPEPGRVPQSQREGVPPPSEELLVGAIILCDVTEVLRQRVELKPRLYPDVKGVVLAADGYNLSNFKPRDARWFEVIEVAVDKVGTKLARLKPSKKPQ